jgi:nucleotide-binding universal stress UspA family protein
MGPIVCATRGSEASRRTQERAIALARERGAPLIFLFIVDTALVRPANKDLAEVVIDELEQLGRGLLCIAQARAREQGVEAEMAIRHGDVQQGVESFLREVNAGVLVIGAPRSGAERPTFDSGALDEFAERIRVAIGAEVIVVK